MINYINQVYIMQNLDPWVYIHVCSGVCVCGGGVYTYTVCVR